MRIDKTFWATNPSCSVILICMLIAVITFTVYLQTGDHQFINFDDPSYVTENIHVSSGITGRNIIWALTSVDAFNWHPITWLSHMADVQFYGLNPRGHHLTNVMIHSVSSLLLLFLLFRCTGSLWQSAFVAALFALHPLHVESVAWVAERKDVLSAFFWFLTLLFYAEYVMKQKHSMYILTLISFMLGLMAKPMLVTLPMVMLLMDYWPLDRYRHGDREHGLRQLSGRVRPLIKEKIPFFACSLLSGIITIYAQHKGGATSSLEALPFSFRIENALVAYVKYIIKTFWPNDLAVLYPITPLLPLWQVIGSFLVLLLISAVAIRARYRHPSFAMGWFWFLVTLLPVIGLIQVGGQSMADRYTYLPVIGLFIMVAWGVPELTKGLQFRKSILVLLAGAVIMASAALTWQQLGYWRDSISLYQHALHVTSGNYVIHYNLGVDLAGKGELDEAIQNYQAAIRIKPNYKEAHNNLGFVLAKKGELDAAIKEYREALLISPNDIKALCNLGDVFVQKGDLDTAIQEYQIALQTDTQNAEVHIKLGNALAQRVDLDAAIQEYLAAIRINPDSFESHNNLGVTLANKGRLDIAIQEYRAALRINPDNADAHNNLGVALTRKGDMEAAINEYHSALQINPNNADTQNNLGIALAKKRLLDTANR